MSLRRVKRRTFSGAVCEQEVYTVAPQIRDVSRAKPRTPRFKTEREREEHREGIARRKHIRQFNANYSPSSLYSTLTLNDENEVHTFDEARRLRDNFARRLLYHAPGARFHIYMGRGKNTHRIHYHMVSEGISEDLIRKLWKMGEVLRTDHLRAHNYYGGVDYGQDYTGLANYLFDHWTPEQGGHRYKRGGKLKSPEQEPAKEAKRAYTEKNPPRAPKGYVLVEWKATKYGYCWFKYVLEPPKRERTRRKGVDDP